jgi:hypothetical protein
VAPLKEQLFVHRDLADLRAAADHVVALVGKPAYRGVTVGDVLEEALRVDRPPVL